MSLAHPAALNQPTANNSFRSTFGASIERLNGRRTTVNKLGLGKTI